jgi:hypothetical protein
MAAQQYSMSAFSPQPVKQRRRIGSHTPDAPDTTPKRHQPQTCSTLAHHRAQPNPSHSPLSFRPSTVAVHRLFCCDATNEQADRSLHAAIECPRARSATAAQYLQMRSTDCSQVRQEGTNQVGMSKDRRDAMEIHICKHCVHHG